MSLRSWLVALVVGSAGAAGLQAQTISIESRNFTASVGDAKSSKRKESHRPIPTATPADQVQQFLAQRLSQARERHELEKIVKDKVLPDALKDPKKYGLKPEQVEKLKQLQGSGGEMPDLNDPKVQKLAEEWMKARQGQPGDGLTGGQVKFSPEQEKMFKKWMAEIAASQPGPMGQPQLPNGMTPTQPGGPPPGGPPGGPPMQPPMPPPGSPGAFPPPPPPSAAKHDDKSGRFGWLDRWVTNNKTLRNSPTMKHLAGSLIRSSRPGGSAEPDRTDRQMARFAEYARFLSPNNSPRSESFLPSLRNWHWPSTPRISSGDSRLPTASGFSGSSWPGLLLLIGLSVLLLGIGWLILRRRKQAAPDPTEAWRLGPWPVDPRGVQTRADLVRAFEHLALLLLGPAARNWHHREIADRLGLATDSDERRQAADHLAQLYEQARYAPQDDSLPEGELEGARRDLCFLAGVAAA